jgi:hypothetical protein
MGCIYGPMIEFRHLNDCAQEGCPGHKLRVVSSRSSDVLSVEIDGKNEYWFDPNCLKAIIE